MNKNIRVIEHPVLGHKLGLLRDEKTTSKEFRSLVKEMTMFMVYEASKDVVPTQMNINAPLGKAVVQKIEDAPILVSVMRAGNGMLEAALEVLPISGAGHIGIYRDKFIENTVEYYFKLPDDSKGKTVYLLDPFLATGDTMVACVDRLKQYQVGNIKVLSFLASRKGLDKVFSFHPDIELLCLSTNDELDEKGYLVPGIGDAGDRLFRTK